MKFSVVDCKGDPRRQGRDQGDQCRSEIQQRLSRAGLPTGRLPWASLRPLTHGRSLGEGAGREIIRHYTHLSERVAGIARGAATPFGSLIELIVRETSGGFVNTDLGTAAAAVAAPRSAQSDGPLLVRGLPVGLDPSYIVRTSHPDVGFPSVEITLPWLATSLAGVNAEGLAAVAVPCATRSTQKSEPRSCRERMPPPLLLVQECLQRFDSLDGCLDWCTKRPSGGPLVLLLADASGETARISFRNGDRLVERTDADPWMEGASSAVCDPVRKRFEIDQVVELPAEGAAAAEVARSSAVSRASSPAVWVDVANRSIQLGTAQTPATGGALYTPPS